LLRDWVWSQRNPLSFPPKTKFQNSFALHPPFDLARYGCSIAAAVCTQDQHLTCHFADVAKTALRSHKCRVSAALDKKCQHLSDGNVSAMTSMLACASLQTSCRADFHP
jgi:hypothetical protein